MSVTHSSNTRNAIADAVLADIDVDTGPGALVLQTVGLAEVATLALSDPAGVVAGPTLTFSPLSDDTNATGGVTTNFVINSNGGGARLLGTVGAIGSNEDIEMSTTTIIAGKNVSITLLTYTAPP